MAHSEHSFIGRLTKDPDLKTINVRGEDTSVCNFTVACDEDFGDGTDFYNVVSWRKQAEVVAKYLQKGSKVFVKGRPRNRSYPVTRDGVEFTQYVTEIHSNTVEFLDSKPRNNDQGSSQQASQNYSEPSIDDEDLPF